MFRFCNNLTKNITLVIIMLLKQKIEMYIFFDILNVYYILQLIFS